ncbi:MAG: addiction module toxin RelE [Candidatus Woesearchaeota archaeon]|jgi:YafQ family addiction module toxin component|nr:addiction module toxin RelE [Candidatus Woesearchaeota archaeon]MDP7181939.1 addiction module toxin RelE [Candidatus Woesearchaeota archaeon]MDP7199254.1 addiction module toxin RelE [Candidatus Woesearchaeota archaeon]MDP7467939.1 addiction module toxin RelE [Candidatus Woesearchaeota archaeon]MDP7647857.1 addiction module toxin RelE [Candidatus Woesearchaeota archaeon]|tara:strand:- start:185 stop:451 length:267 start_codon:yes stop_codon:yes gene_type:complete
MQYEIHPDLDKTLAKLSKKDPKQFEILLKKIEEVIKSDPSHYKNLKRPLQHYKRVHVKSSFVLLFRHEESKIIFRYYDHHDNIYDFKE